MDRIPCSVLVLTRLAGATIARCLEHLAPFGEILVHDANSADGTAEIARSLGARVLKQYETDEPNVRVKDFTEMRLKQRADAAFDWVLYLDADEEMPPGLVSEVGDILKAAHQKTIVKFLRLPVVEGRLIRHGAFWPEIVPRIHHRKGGCTLRAGKTVHEKYVYDASFTEVITRNALHVPMEPLEILHAKDDTYLALERERWRARGRKFLGSYARWFLLREPVLMLHILSRILLCRMRFHGKECLPLSYELRIVRYHWKIFSQATTTAFRGMCLRSEL